MLPPLPPAAETPAASSSSGGGGGGSSASNTTSTTSTAVKQTLAATVKANVAATLKVTKAGIPVKEIVLTLSSDRTAAKVTVEKLSAQPASTPALSGASLGFLSLEKSGFENSDVASAKIAFEVSKEDLDAKGVTPENVVLLRYTTQWDTLVTTSEGLSGSVYKFSALTPGFSYFAISAKAEPKVEEAVVTEPEVAPETVTAPTTDETNIAGAATGLPSSGRTTLIVLAFVVLVAIAGLWYWKKK